MLVQQKRYKHMQFLHPHHICILQLVRPLVYQVLRRTLSLFNSGCVMLQDPYSLILIPPNQSNNGYCHGISTIHSFHLELLSMRYTILVEITGIVWRSDSRVQRSETLGGSIYVVYIYY